MTIKVGDHIPNATLNYLKDGVQAINTDEIFKTRKKMSCCFPVPGAFTFADLLGQAPAGLCAEAR